MSLRASFSAKYRMTSSFTRYFEMSLNSSQSNLGGTVDAMAIVVIC